MRAEQALTDFSEYGGTGEVGSVWRGGKLVQFCFEPAVHFIGKGRQIVGALGVV
jgi:hypothetical protein